MNVHEFQAKELLARFGIEVPTGRLAETAADAEIAAKRLGCARFVVKAQILAGDRGRHGGVRFAANPAQVRKEAAELLGARLATGQTSARGLSVKWVYIEEAIEAAQHLYVGVVLDRSTGRPYLLASSRGGDNIEALAAGDSSVIQRTPLTISKGGADGDCAGLAQRIGLTGAAATAVEQALRRLAAAFVALDASLLEINPLALTADARLIALDAKLTIDDNALFRHADLRGLRDFTAQDEGDPVELAAQRHQINYLRLDGDVGVVVNGAGLALATLDLLCDAGGRPANFMDIRTTASSLDIAYGFGLILANPAVRSILVNVHGGGMQACDTIAEGIGIAVRRNPARTVPIVISMAGNHAEFARTVLANTGVAYIGAANMREAVQAAAALAKKEHRSWLFSSVAKRA
jgi:succinyl-CoA synthetase beta subunit